MKIAINCIFCQPQGGGIKEYIYNIVNAISLQDKDNTFLLYVLKDGEAYAKSLLPHSGRFQIKTLPYGSSLGEVIKRSLFSDLFWRKEERIEKFDLFHSPFFHAPKLKHAKVVVTVHDLRFYRYPSTYTFLRYCFLRYSVRKSLLQADHIITISSFTKSEIQAAYGIPSSKITVVLEAINRSDFSANRINENELPSEIEQIKNKPYILSVGHLEPRKNYDRLLNAFLILKKSPEAKDLKLIIVGKKGHHFKSLISKMEQMKDVIYLDFVSRNSLLWLYHNASVFSFPSIYEGFGFPPLEAACMGTISSVANISSMPEVCGDSVDYCNPFSVEDIADSLHRCLYDNSTIAKLQERMSANLNRFSWENNAAMTLAVYNEVCK